MSLHRPSTPYIHHPSPPQASSTRATAFLTNHTASLSHSSHSPPLNTECPICLESIEAHPCVKIVKVSGCAHLFGLKCLEDMLDNNPGEEKKCPLCRAVWYRGEEDGFWVEGEGEVAQGELGTDVDIGLGDWGGGWAEEAWDVAGRGVDWTSSFDSGEGRRGGGMERSSPHRPFTSAYPSASHAPSIRTTSPHPQSPTFNDHPNSSSRPRLSTAVPSHNQPHYASSHMSSSASIPFHQPSSTSHEPRRPPRGPLLDTAHPPFVDEDGELMVWIDDDVYAQMEASGRGGGISLSRQYSVRGGQSSRGPVYGDFQVSERSSFGGEDYGHSREFRGISGDRSARGMSDGLDDMFGEGGLFGHGSGRQSWGDYGRGRDLWSDY